MHPSVLIPFLILGLLGGTVTIEPVHDGEEIFGMQVTAWDIRSGVAMPVWVNVVIRCPEGHLHCQSTPVKSVVMW